MADIAHIFGGAFVPPPEGSPGQTAPYQRHIPDVFEFPHDLAELPIWCAWKLVNKPGEQKPDKVPVSPIDGSEKWSRPEFCTTARRAIYYAEANPHLNGVGIILRHWHDLAGGDLDGCRDPETGKPTEQARRIIESADTYTEVSPGLRGFRFIARGSFGGHTGRDQNNGIEFYEGDRFLTLTGWHIESTPFAIEERDLSSLGAEYFSKSKSSAANVEVPETFEPVDLGRFGLSDYSRRLIQQGPPADSDRSAHLFGVAKDLIRAGASASDAIRVLVDPKNAISACALERRRGDLSSAMDWVARYTIPRAREAVQAEADDLDATGRDSTVWPEALDLFGNLEPEPFPVNLLPACIADFAQDQGELMGVDPGVIGLASLAVVAGCTDDRIRIQPKRHDPTWTESARLWFAGVGPPSAKKSPALDKAMGPAFKVDADWRQESNQKRKAYEHELDRIKRSKSDERPPDPPTYKRLIFGDTTVEKMGAVMAECEPRGVLVFRDELTGWLSSMDAYKNGGGKDRADWLEAYNGGPHGIDRISRGSTFIENWSASVIGGIQPTVIHEYAGNNNHDGMLQRFVILFARNARQGQDRRPNMDAKGRYEAAIRQLADTRPGFDPVRLSDGAHEAREALWDRLHKLTLAHPNPFLTAALGKWEGLFSRLLLTFHAADCADRHEHPSATPVDQKTAERVSELMWGTLLPHAIRFYRDLDETEDHARKVAGLILARGWPQFTVKRDLDRHLSQSRRWAPWQVDEAMQRLESFGWLMPKPDRLNERGRPSAYLVNPSVHTRFAAVAEQERHNREVVAETLRGLGS